MGALSAPRLGVNKDYWIQTTEYNGTYSLPLITSNHSYIWSSETSTTIAFNSTAKIIKYNLDGSIVWQKLLTDIKNLWINCIKVDSSNNCYISGTVGNDATNFDIQYGYIAKINSSGTVLWEKIVNRAVSQSSSGVTRQNIQSISLDSSGNIYAALQYWNTVDVIKYDNNGNVIWNKSIANIGSSSVGAQQLVADSSGNCYVTSQGDSSELYIVKLDSSGSIVWQKGIKSYWASYEMYIDIDSNGNIWVGTQNISSTSYSTFLKFDTSGNLLSATKYPGIQSPIGAFQIDTNDEIFYSILGDQYINNLDSSASRIWQHTYDITSQKVQSISLTGKSYLLSNRFSIGSLPKNGTKLGTYTLSSYSVVYSDVAFSSSSSASTTITNYSQTISSISNFSSSSYSTTVTTPTYTPTIKYL